MTTWTEHSLFDGPNDTADEGRDVRLMNQLQRVYHVMRNGDQYTLSGLAMLAKAPEGSVAARIRDLRKPRFGQFTIETKSLDHGLYGYRLVPGSGDEDLVFNPSPAEDSGKADARQVLTEYLDAQRRLPPDFPYTRPTDEIVNAIEVMLR